MRKTTNPKKTASPGESLANAFSKEISNAESRASATSAETVNVELPWGRDMKVGRTVELKYKKLWKFWVVGKGRWTECSRTKQRIEGEFSFTWQIKGSVISYTLKAQRDGKKINESGKLTVKASRKCDDCSGNRNNATHLTGAVNGGKFSTWPKNSDRVRIVLVEANGDEHQIELDTKE